VSAALLSGAELENALRRIGEERYHHRHPFHHLMRDGKLIAGRFRPGR